MKLSRQLMAVLLASCGNGDVDSLRPGTGEDLSCATHSSAPSGEAVPGSWPGELLLNRKYRELFESHLSRVWNKLFADFTGLHFHIAWKPAAPKKWDANALSDGCSICCRLCGSPRPPKCWACGPRHLDALLKSRHGHRFTCQLGVRNYWVPIRVQGETLGFAYLQALESSLRMSPSAMSSTSTARARSARRRGSLLTGIAFARAARFMQQIIEQAQTASLSDLREADFESVTRLVVALEKELAKLQERGRRPRPDGHAIPRSDGPQTRAEQVVHQVLERIRLDYMKPISLQGLARELGMNTTYVSTLFARSVGVPFKTYLTELRIQHAKELLRNHTRTVSEAAFAAGYASDNRFRIAFKKATGLSPNLWRATLHLPPPTPAVLSAREPSSTARSKRQPTSLPGP